MPPKRGRRTAIPSGKLDGAGGPAMGQTPLPLVTSVRHRVGGLATELSCGVNPIKE